MYYLFSENLQVMKLKTDLFVYLINIFEIKRTKLLKFLQKTTYESTK